MLVILIIKLSGCNIGKYIHDFEIVKDFLNCTQNVSYTQHNILII